VDVGVVEAGRDEAAAEVYGARGAEARGKLARRADGGDAVAFDGDGLGQRPAPVGGEDLAVDEEEVGRLPARGEAGRRSQEAERAGQGDGQRRAGPRRPACAGAKSHVRFIVRV
jgi:hypothetical protein